MPQPQSPPVGLSFIDKLRAGGYDNPTSGAMGVSKYLPSNTDSTRANLQTLGHLGESPNSVLGRISATTGPGPDVSQAIPPSINSGLSAPGSLSTFPEFSKQHAEGALLGKTLLGDPSNVNDLKALKKASLILRLSSFPGHVKSAEGVLDSLMQGDLQGAGAGISKGFQGLDPHAQAALLGGLGGGALGLATGHPIKGALGGAALGAGGYAALGDKGAFHPQVMRMLAMLRGEEAQPTGATIGEGAGDSALTAPPAQGGTVGADLGFTPPSVAGPNADPAFKGGFVPRMHGGGAPPAQPEAAPVSLDPWNKKMQTASML